MFSPYQESSPETLVNFEEIFQRFIEEDVSIEPKVHVSNSAHFDTTSDAAHGIPVTGLPGVQQPSQRRVSIQPPTCQADDESSLGPFGFSGHATMKEKVSLYGSRPSGLGADSPGRSFAGLYRRRANEAGRITPQAQYSESDKKAILDAEKRLSTLAEVRVFETVAHLDAIDVRNDQNRHPSHDQPGTPAPSESDNARPGPFINVRRKAIRWVCTDFGPWIPDDQPSTSTMVDQVLFGEKYWILIHPENVPTFMRNADQLPAIASSAEKTCIEPKSYLSVSTLDARGIPYSIIKQKTQETVTIPRGCLSQTLHTKPSCSRFVSWADCKSRDETGEDETVIYSRCETEAAGEVQQGCESSCAASRMLDIGPCGNSMLLDNLSPPGLAESGRLSALGAQARREVPGGSAPPQPTIFDQNVYDSRDPRLDLNAEHTNPRVIVSREENVLSQRASRASGRPSLDSAPRADDSPSEASGPTTPRVYSTMSYINMDEAQSVYTEFLRLCDGKAEYSGLLCGMYFATATPRAFVLVSQAIGCIRSSARWSSLASTSFVSTLQSLDQLDASLVAAATIRRYLLARLVEQRLEHEEWHKRVRDRPSRVTKAATAAEQPRPGKYSRPDVLALSGLMSEAYPTLRPTRLSQVSHDDPYQRKLKKMKDRIRCGKVWHLIRHHLSEGVLMLIQLDCVPGLYPTLIEKLPLPVVHIFIDVLQRRRGNFLAAVGARLLPVFASLVIGDGRAQRLKLENASESDLMCHARDSSSWIDLCTEEGACTDEGGNIPTSTYYGG